MNVDDSMFVCILRLVKEMKAYGMVLEWQEQRKKITDIKENSQWHEDKQEGNTTPKRVPNALSHAPRNIGDFTSIARLLKKRSTTLHDQLPHLRQT